MKEIRDRHVTVLKSVYGALKSDFVLNSGYGSIEQ
jgi:hypothetical protein